MLIGILSDTHDRVESAREALKLLHSLGAEVIIHCGDLCTEPILDLLVSDLPAYFVFGNNEPDMRGLTRYAKALGLHCLGDSAIITLGGRTFGITHGHLSELVDELLAAKVDYLLSGHTHIAADEKFGSTRLVNPGAIHRTRQKSVATIDTVRDVVTFHTF